MTREQLLGTGISASAIQRRLRRGVLPEHPGVYPSGIARRASRRGTWRRSHAGSKTAVAGGRHTLAAMRSAVSRYTYGDVFDHRPRFMLQELRKLFPHLPA